LGQSLETAITATLEMCKLRYHNKNVHCTMGFCFVGLIVNVNDMTWRKVSSVISGAAWLRWILDYRS